MVIAIVGDIHGRLKEMYERLDAIERSKRITIEDVFQIGDFKAFRDETDMRYMRGPQRYRDLGDFPHFSDIGRVPKKTFFIGGNHENDYWHRQHPNGHQVLDNLFYLGRSGITEVGSLNFAWVSGNYSPVDFEKNPPKTYSHFTKEDLQKILEAKDIDVLLLHDCPSFSEMASKVSPEVSTSNDFQESLRRGLGNKPLYELIRKLKPRYSLSGHIHHNFDFSLPLEGANTRLVILSELGNPGSIYLLDNKHLSLA